MNFKREKKEEEEGKKREFCQDFLCMGMNLSFFEHLPLNSKYNFNL